MNNYSLFGGEKAGSAAPNTSEKSQDSRAVRLSDQKMTAGSVDAACVSVKSTGADTASPATTTTVDAADWKQFDLSRVRFVIEEIPEAERVPNSSLRSRIVAEYEGNPIMLGGRRFVVRGSLRPFAHQLYEKLRELNDCAMCREQAFGAAGPEHKGSVMCESGSPASGGKSPHCSCDTCF